MKPLLVVCGPTASGKTELAIRLCERFNGEVVSADSMQVYQGMDIGTAKPTKQELARVPHHLIGFLPREEAFSVARYAELAREVIRDIHSRGKLPVLAGGTGLYIQAVVDGIRFGDMPEDAALRERLREEADLLGGAVMLERLRAADPVLAGGLHPNNKGRILRGLEVLKLTGVPLSEWQRESMAAPREYGIAMLGLSYRDRQLLYDRINRRVDVMLELGLEQEARGLFESGMGGTAVQAIGYKELAGYFRGEQTLLEAGERLKMQTRRYAKRQLTWFGRDPRVQWLYVDDYPNKQALFEAAYAITGIQGVI